MIVDDLIHKAEDDSRKTIVLAEGSDDRVLRAACICQQQHIAKIILLGHSDKIKHRANELNLDLGTIVIINPRENDYLPTFSDVLYGLRKHKGVTPHQAHELVRQSCYFAAMLVHQGIADGYVAGAIHATSDTLRPALQIIKTPSPQHIASSYFVMVTPQNDVYFFADCALVKNPTDNELALIAIDTADSAKSFGYNPKIAMLSFSTKGSAKDQLLDKVIKATSIVKQKRHDLVIDGEMQLDAAIIPEVAKKKCPISPIQGDANVLIFPDLNSGNIGYKLVQRFAHATAIGPIVQGLNKPVNDLSRGCNVEDIVDVVAITAITAHKKPFN